MHLWLTCVQAVSDLTKYDWEKVFKMSALEFFAFLSFVNYQRRKEQLEMQRINAKYKRH